ncbi:MAG: DUF4177 domain-containing protein [Armatimonadetes bacterium]|nr:DUF4177 domain-containing protein [Armatimonadota bacterium]PIU60613.1 MAG: hypothetical protein COS85_23560 [Armatimonadetes bacterium CG07_land_8_20_14_0_80_59_28]PIX44770.1 MAG: hypothetical protein COZ56_03725 [Armatimonadetes bacterium CG_4_8_14_3_um_filter_58_9]PIY38102.1 MAG: hypothetical protein COZ05_21350 [Armatimonadetes bacterium CG_4_10_14_3_um_filter_59_10]PJB73909.1 MAG: hypothetical protein CO095_05280 [Armatimonadetes bacterium CG_4_9_14_3_um_filter_58_7]
MEKWEYKVVEARAKDDLERLMTQLGAEGWEFVDLEVTNFTIAGRVVIVYVAVMKRAKA